MKRMRYSVAETQGKRRSITDALAQTTIRYDFFVLVLGFTVFGLISFFLG